MATVVAPHQLRNHGLDERLGSLLQDGVRGLQPIRPGLGRIGLRARVTKHERGHPHAKAAPEFKQDVSANGTSDECRFANAGGIENAGNVAGVLRHESRPFANLGIAMPAQIGENQPVARFERGCYRIPEFAMTWKRMEKNDRRAVSPNFIEDLGVVAAQAFHGRRLYVEVEDGLVESGLPRRRLRDPHFAQGRLARRPQATVLDS